MTATSGATLQLIPREGELADEHPALAPTTALTKAQNITSDGSTVFFETLESLVPADRNGVRDVYEWREGVLSLISSGTGTTGSFFLGASDDGRDVFFATFDPLTPDDTDGGAESVYDARVDGGFAAASEGGCQAEECRGASLGGAPSLPLPGSAVLNGPGNSRAPKARCHSRRHHGKKRRCVKGSRRNPGKGRAGHHRAKKKHAKESGRTRSRPSGRGLKGAVK